MKIAILGGGFTGLTAAYDLSRKGHEVALFEKEPILGGLAVGFKGDGWSWRLERAYHHLFASDRDILNFASEIGFQDIFFKAPETASLYPPASKKANYRIFPVDTPQDFLRLPILSIPAKIRAVATLAFLKFSPYLSLFESYTSHTFLKNTMGREAYGVMFENLLRKKFGKYAENVLIAFMWARITKRTKKLGYIKGGFQTLVEYLEKKNNESGVIIRKGTGVVRVIKKKNHFIVDIENSKSEIYDVVISTLPTTIMARITGDLFSVDYLSRFKKLHYLHAVVLILEMKEKILSSSYWLNICDPKLPLMFIGQHTNFIDKKYYNNNNIAYIGWYVDQDSELLKMSEKELVHFVSPHLKKINKRISLKNAKKYMFKAPFAQPIFDHDFVVNKPDFKTPVEGFYIANLDMTYPYDRGTNYAVQLGREVAKLL